MRHEQLEPAEPVLGDADDHHEGDDEDRAVRCMLIFRDEVEVEIDGEVDVDVLC
jgi:hypothetical protein